MGWVSALSPLALLGGTQVLQVKEWEQTWRGNTSPALSPSVVRAPQSPRLSDLIMLQCRGLANARG